MNWYALYVKSRHEFVVSDELHRKGVETFLPSVTKFNQWKDRKKQVETPLFPGYLFVCFEPNPEKFLNVIKTRGTVTFVCLQPGHPAQVDPEEINSLKIMLASGKPIDICPHLQEGAAVRIKRGIFQGAQGILVKKQNQHKFIVTITLLGRSVGVNIYADDLEAV